MKRFITLSIILCMLTATLSACSGKKAANAEADNASATTTTTSSVAADAETDGTTTTLPQGENTTTTTANTTIAANTTTTTAATKTNPTKPYQTTTTAPQPVKKSTKYEVSTSSVKTVSGAKLERAWKLSENGVDIEIHRIAYGNKITQHFTHGKGGFSDQLDNAIDYEKTVTYQPYATVAIVTANPEKLMVSSAKQLLGKNSAKVEDMAKKAGALIAVNCEASASGKGYSEPVRRYSIVRNGVIVQDYNAESKVQPLLMYRDGTWKYASITSANSKDRVSDGLYNTIRHQDISIVKGKITTGIGDAYHHNRTMIGQISANKYVLMVGEFMPVIDMAEILVKYGVQSAVVTNGGNCSYMYVKGIGNTTGTTGQKLKNLNKVNILETEFFGTHGLLANGKKGEDCYEADILYFK